MTERISKVQRWLDLVSFLVGRRFPVDVEEVMRSVPAYAERWTEGDDTDRASVRRMFERDKDELRELGIPLETVSYSINWGSERAEGYRLSRKDFYLPYLRLLSSGRPEPDEPDRDLPVFELREEEAHLALDALHQLLERDAFPLLDDARAARRKLTFDLGQGQPEAGERPGGERLPVLWVEPPGAAELIDVLEDLSDALLRRKHVRFVYHGIRRDEPTEREVEPWGLLFQHGHWYLVGHDRDRDARRVFRVGRMEALKVNTRRATSTDYDIPADFDLDELRERDAWELGDDPPVRARVRFRFPRSLWAERNDVGTRVRQTEDGDQIRSFQVVQAGPFVRWLLSLGGDAQILEPPELVERFREMAGAVADLYRADSGESEAADG